MTLFKRNVGEIEDVLRLMLQRGIDSLGVGLLILVGNGEKIRDEELNPQQYRELLVRLLAFLDNEAKDTKLRRNFLRQMPMYGRLFYELGRYDEYRELAMHSPRRGGPEGRLLFVVWPDGEVVPRREMAPVGYVPRQSFSKIYKDSYLLQLFENEEFLRAQRAEKQRDFVRCRECPASERCGVGVAVFSSRLIYYPSPHCWVPIA
jgi:MoaA/NifB/PqqE/SkfB family radical SAM enzyme